MKKMPCLFERDFTDKRNPILLERVTPGCEWVIAGEGVATRKWDGTAAAVIDGVLHKRYDAKRHPTTGEYKMPPPGSIPCSDPDPVTGHWPHWVAVDAAKPEDKHFVAASKALVGALPNGTYELIGPPIGGNHERAAMLAFVRHGVDVIFDAPRDFHGLREWLMATCVEGIVFAHEDGRMCKIRRDDYGFAWPPKA